jgi:hypothetical protein
MGIPGKFLLLLLFFCCCLSSIHAQNNKWILGEWKGIGIIPGSDYSTVFVRILRINIETKNRFAGLVIQEVMNNKSIRIEKELSGTILNDQITLVTGRTLYKKQPLHGFWADCSSCKMTNTRITVSSDSLILTNETRLCGNYCDGYSTYYKPLSDFDTATQRKLVQLFGSPLLAKIFKPVTPASKYNTDDLQATQKTKPYLQTETGIQQHSITDTSERNHLAHAANETNADNDTTQKQLGRKNKTIATYSVSSAEIKIELYDNGEIDGDTVTVYHNKQRVIDRQLLGLKPIVYTVKADARDRVHEFILVANNLGRIPPNTALMRITAGTKTYEVFASTNLAENASVIIIYSGD